MIFKESADGKETRESDITSMIKPSFNQVISGFGIPVALQTNSMLSPWLTTVSPLISVTFGGTERRATLLYYVVSLSQQQIYC